MRTFIAIKLTGETQNKLVLALKPFKKISSPIRWTKPESLHLTLKFLGDIPKDKVIEITNVLLTIKKSTDEDLILNFNGFGYFGQRDLLKILWIKIASNNILTDLYNEIENRLEKIGFPMENRRFLPHLTAGRNKTRFDLKKYHQIFKDTEEQKIITQKVSSFHLMESELRPAGAEYAAIKEFNLE